MGLNPVMSRVVLHSSYTSGSLLSCVTIPSSSTFSSIFFNHVPISWSMTLFSSSGCTLLLTWRNLPSKESTQIIIFYLPCLLRRDPLNSECSQESHKVLVLDKLEFIPGHWYNPHRTVGIPDVSHFDLVSE